MSWLPRSISNSLLLDRNHQYDVVSYNKTRPPPESTNHPKDLAEDQEDIVLRNDRLPNDNNNNNNEGRGVKEDLSELTETVTRQLLPSISMKRDGLLLLIEEAEEERLVNFCDDFGDGKLPNGSLIQEVEEEDSGNFCDNKLINRSLVNEGVIEEDLRTFCDNSDDFGDGKLLNRSLIDEVVIEEDLERSYCNGDDEQLLNRSLMKEEVEEEDLGRSYCNGDDEQLLNRSLMKEEDLGRSYCNGDDEELVNQSLMKEEVEEEDLGRSCDNGDEFDDRDDEEDGVEGAVGVTEEALAFAHNVAHHPETWLDFPVEEEDEEGFIDFRISDSQYKHALAIERCVPTLAALRIELCPVHMSEGYFWMVYFVLLHSRLCKSDADQLSSDELVLARSTWREELKKRAKPETDWFGRSTFHLRESTLSPRGDFDPELLEDSDTKHLTFSTYYAGSRAHHETTYNGTENQIVECDEAKSADTPGNSERDLLTFQSAQIIQDDDDDGEDDWLQDTADLDGYSSTGIVVNEEDVSFSDLEEDSDWTTPIKSK